MDTCVCVIVCYTGSLVHVHGYLCMCMYIVCYTGSLVCVHGYLCMYMCHCMLYW